MALDAFLIEAGQHGPYAIDHDAEDFNREVDGIAYLSRRHGNGASVEDMRGSAH